MGRRRLVVDGGDGGPQERDRRVPATGAADPPRVPGCAESTGDRRGQLLSAVRRRAVSAGLFGPPSSCGSLRRAAAPAAAARPNRASLRRGPFPRSPATPTASIRPGPRGDGTQRRRARICPDIFAPIVSHGLISTPVMRPTEESPTAITSGCSTTAEKYDCELASAIGSDPE